MYTLLAVRRLPSGFCIGMALVVVLINALLFQRAFAQTPTPFLISPYFGQETRTQLYSAGHTAYDFSMNYERVLAAAGGTVDQSQWYNNNCHNSATWPNDPNGCGYGLYIRVDHGNNYRTIYAHLSAARIANASVSQGQIIATSGNTGWSTAAHLHFQVQHFLNNVWTSIDPFDESGVSLWVDGEWASLSRPIPEPINGGEAFTYVTTDNTGGFSKGENNGVLPPPFNNACTGNCANWLAATSTYGYMYSTLVNGSTPDSWAKWQAPVSANGGMYEVFVYLPGDNATSWQAPYTIRYFNNLLQATALVDQYGSGNRWLSLGTYYMTNNDYVFTTDATGEFRGTHCGADQLCKLGVDAVKFVRRGTTYAPYVVGAGWSSRIVVMNDGGGPALSRMVVYDNNGAAICVGFTDIPLSAYGVQTWVLNATGCPGGAAATIDSSQAIGVIVENHSGTYGYAYTARSAPSSASTGYMPQILQYLNSVWKTTIQVMNTSAQSTNITTNFYSQSGGSGGTTTLSNVAVNDSSDIAQPMPNGNTLYVGRMSATQSAASVVRVSDGSANRRLAYTSIPVADTTVWLPFVMTRLGNSWGAALWIQNTTGTGSTVTLDFYQNGVRSGGGTESLPGNGLATINLRTDYARYGLPAGWSGSAKVSADVPMAVVVNQLNDEAGLGASYEGVPNSTGSTVVLLPNVVRRPADALCYYSNFAVRNLGGAAANVQIGYYNQDGTLAVSVPDTGISSERIYNLYISAPAGLPYNFRGSVVIVSTNTQPIAATSNMVYYASSSCTSRDDTISYTGINR